MKQRKRIPPKRSKPRRKRPNLFHKRERDARFIDPRSYVTKGGRVRLFGDDYKALRFSAWARANGICECGCRNPAIYFCDFVGIPCQGELSHNEHGPRKSDELERVKWMRHECHMKRHNAGGKPVPKKPNAYSGSSVTS